MTSGSDGVVRNLRLVVVQKLAHSLAAAHDYVRAIGNTGRRGKGFAIRCGVAQATGDVIGFIDADNKTPIDEFDHVHAAFSQGADLVIGSRALAGARIERRQPWHRRVGAKAFATFMHATVGLPDVPDTQCGFKFFRQPVARDLFSRQIVDGYMFDVEILSLAKEAGYRLAQVPVRWRDDGDSRLRLLAGNIRNAADIMRIRRGLQARRRTRPNHVRGASS